MKSDTPFERYVLIGSMAVIIGLTLVLYWPTQTFDFVNYDDDGYIRNSSFLFLGLNAEGIRAAFTNTEMCNWHPLTSLSYMVDWQLYRLNPGGYHWTNVQLHIAATAALYGALWLMTRAAWPSLYVAALFALHPLHVESVAWVSERKDVLSALMLFLALAAYTVYARRPSWVHYVLVMALFGVGLMSKPMLVTFPMLLLLLDYWPLCRTAAATTVLDPWLRGPVWVRLIVEKVPMLALSAGASAMTLYVQQAGDCVVELTKLPLSVRASNAVVAYVEYIRKMVWPSDLAVFYPHPGLPPNWQIAAAAGILVTVSAVALRFGRRMPFLPVGWFWYLGTLVPVIGIVQVGSQALADRYTYIPLLGLFIMLAWGTAAMAEKMPKARGPLLASILGILVVLSLLSAKQIATWKDSITLFSRALEVTVDNKTARNNLGVALVNQYRFQEALPYFLENLKRKNPDESTYYNAAICLVKLGRCDEAEPLYREAVRLNPRELRSRADYAGSLTRCGYSEQAEAELRAILAINPRLDSAYFHLASLAIIQRRYSDGEAFLKETLRIKPDSLEALNNMGAIYIEMGRAAEAIPYLEKASELVEDSEVLQKNLAKAYALSAQGASARTK